MKARVHSAGSHLHSVEIHEADGGYYLLSVTESGEIVADTWHHSLELALAQAKFQLEIEESAWIS